MDFHSNLFVVENCDHIFQYVIKCKSLIQIVNNCSKFQFNLDVDDRELGGY